MRQSHLRCPFIVLNTAGFPLRESTPPVKPHSEQKGTYLVGKHSLFLRSLRADTCFPRSPRDLPFTGCRSALRWLPDSTQSGWQGCQTQHKQLPPGRAPRLLYSREVSGGGSRSLGGARDLAVRFKRTNSCRDCKDYPRLTALVRLPFKDCEEGVGG